MHIHRLEAIMRAMRAESLNQPLYPHSMRVLGTGTPASCLHPATWRIPGSLPRAKHLAPCKTPCPVQGFCRGIACQTVSATLWTMPMLLSMLKPYFSSAKLRCALQGKHPEQPEANGKRCPTDDPLNIAHGGVEEALVEAACLPVQRHQ